MTKSISQKTRMGASAAVALGYAWSGIAAPIGVSALDCYYCCEDQNDCGTSGWVCRDFGGINCQDTTCHYGGGTDFCATS